jgi:hypothetical protein
MRSPLPDFAAIFIIVIVAAALSSPTCHHQSSRRHRHHHRRRRRRHRRFAAIFVVVVSPSPSPPPARSISGEAHANRAHGYPGYPWYVRLWYRMASVDFLLRSTAGYRAVVIRTRAVVVRLPRTIKKYKSDYVSYLLFDLRFFLQ